MICNILLFCQLACNFVSPKTTSIIRLDIMQITKISAYQKNDQILENRSRNTERSTKYNHNFNSFDSNNIRIFSDIIDSFICSDNYIGFITQIILDKGNLIFWIKIGKSQRWLLAKAGHPLTWYSGLLNMNWGDDASSKLMK